jgi:hypothetical protein
MQYAIGTVMRPYILNHCWFGRHTAHGASPSANTLDISKNCNGNKGRELFRYFITLMHRNERECADLATVWSHLRRITMVKATNTHDKHGINRSQCSYLVFLL